MLDAGAFFRCQLVDNGRRASPGTRISSRVICSTSPSDCLGVYQRAPDHGAADTCNTLIRHNKSRRDGRTTGGCALQTNIRSVGHGRAFGNFCFHIDLAGGDFCKGGRNLRLRGVVLISGQGNSRQNTNDRHNDHQFDKSKACLRAAGDRTTVHFTNSRLVGLVVTPGSPPPGAKNLPQHPCHPF